MKKIFVSLILVFTSICANSQIIVSYPNINGLGKSTINYAILDLALEKSGVDYKINLQDYKVNDVTQRKMLSEGKIDVADFGTSKEFEDEFLAVYFPIDLGANGWRIFVIHKDNKQKISKVKNLKELQSLTTGMGLGWADIKIFEDSGIKVLQAPQISNLMAMLNRKRFCYFSLGAQNAYWHLENHIDKNPNLVMEENIVIVYPFARFFFVRKNNFELRDILLKGLIASFDDGSLIELFKTHPSGRDLFYRSNMRNRIQIKMPNNHVSENFEKIPKKYFFNISMLDKAVDQQLTSEIR